MTKFGLKRIPAPKTWNIKKKKIRFTTRPFPGPFKFNQSLTLTVILRDYLKFVTTMREAKFVVKYKNSNKNANPRYIDFLINDYQEKIYKLDHLK